MRIGITIAQRTESGLQTHPLLIFVFSLHLALDFGLVCKTCTIRRWFFDSGRALQDPACGLAKLLHVRCELLLDKRNGVAQCLRQWQIAEMICGFAQD